MSVSVRFRPTRVKSFSPRVASSVRICALTVGCPSRSSAAARVTLPLTRHDPEVEEVMVVEPLHRRDDGISIFSACHAEIIHLPYRRATRMRAPVRESRHVPVLISLGGIASVLVVSVAASWLWPPASAAGAKARARGSAEPDAEHARLLRTGGRRRDVARFRA